VLPALQFTETKEMNHLSSLKRNEGPDAVIPPTSSRKLTQGRKRARTRTRRNDAKDRCAEQFNATQQPNQSGGDASSPPGDEATQEASIRRPRGNKDVAQSGGRECHGWSF